MILLVVGAGAFFGVVLRATGVGAALAGSMTAGGLPVILSAYLISSALRLAQGSATVAIVTTAGIIEPIVAAGGYSQPQIALIIIAVSAGSIIASHVNDGGFWIVAKYFQHVGQGHAQDLDRAGDDPVGPRVRDGRAGLAGRVAEPSVAGEWSSPAW